MSDESDPPRKFYDFKPREFVNVNSPAPSAPAPARPAAPNSAGGPIDVHEIYRQANAAPEPAAIQRPVPGRKNDVHVILDDNLARANAAGLNEIAPAPRRSTRRKRDYIFVMTLVNGFFVIIFATSGNIFALAGMGMFSAVLTWIMWFVMDNY